MNEKKEERRRCLDANLTWVIDNPTSSHSAGLTAYRPDFGFKDLFSVYLKFSNPIGAAGIWQTARIFALVEEMEDRLPSTGERLVITAGSRVVAFADIVSDGFESL